MDHSRGSNFRTLAQLLFMLKKFDESTSGRSKPIKNLGTFPEVGKWLSAKDEVPQSFQDLLHVIYDVSV
jgi:hypothetical protein